MEDKVESYNSLIGYTWLSLYPTWYSLLSTCLTYCGTPLILCFIHYFFRLIHAGNLIHSCTNIVLSLTILQYYVNLKPLKMNVAFNFFTAIPMLTFRWHWNYVRKTKPSIEDIRFIKVLTGICTASSILASIVIAFIE